MSVAGSDRVGKGLLVKTLVVMLPSKQGDLNRIVIAALTGKRQLFLNEKQQNPCRLCQLSQISGTSSYWDGKWRWIYSIDFYLPEAHEKFLATLCKTGELYPFLFTKRVLFTHFHALRYWCRHVTQWGLPFVFKTLFIQGNFTEQKPFSCRNTQITCTVWFAQHVLQIKWQDRAMVRIKVRRQLWSWLKKKLAVGNSNPKCFFLNTQLAQHGYMDH